MSDPNASQEPERCCFDDWVDHWEKRSRKKHTVSGVTAHLLEALAGAGLAGRSVLDVGCGIGDLALAALARGAVSAEGFDLSEKAIVEARRLAEERGLAARSRFEVGDGSKLDLPPADVVVLNRVLCCYPDADGLIDRSLAASRSVYAFTAPVSSGLVGMLNRSRTWLWNAYYRLRKEKFAGFQTYVHDIARIEESVKLAGYRPVRRERRRVVWDLAVYSR